MASGKLREIERLRGLAAVAIVFVHWKFITTELPPALRNPETGVDLFFVISGFVVTSSLLRLLPNLEGAPDFAAAFETSRTVIRKFYARRFFRILPAALAVMLLQRIAVDVFPKEFGTAFEWEREVACFLAGIYNFALPAGLSDKFSVYWSLSVEEQYYLFIPLLFVALRTRSKRVGACAAIIVLVALVFRPMGDPAIQLGPWYRLFSSQFRFDSLMAGTGLALLWPAAPGAAFAPPLLPPRLVRFVIVPLATFLVFAIPRVAPEYVWHREGFMASWALSTVLVAYAAMDRGYVFGFPGVGRVLEWLGARSYALYLVHFPMMRLETSLIDWYPRYGAFLTRPGRSPWVHFAILFAATLVVVELLHQLVEKPFLRAGAAVSRTGSEAAVPPWMRWATVAIGITIVGYWGRHRLFLLTRSPNLARQRGVVITASSQSADCKGTFALANGELEPEKGFCTESEKDPWIEIDLGQVEDVGTVYVYNRADNPLDEQLPLEVSLSEDHADYNNATVTSALFTQGRPFKKKVPPGVKTRYVRLAVHRPTRLTLSEVEVFGR